MLLQISPEFEVFQFCLHCSFHVSKEQKYCFFPSYPMFLYIEEDFLHCCCSLEESKLSSHFIYYHRDYFPKKRRGKNTTKPLLIVGSLKKKK